MINESADHVSNGNRQVEEAGLAIEKVVISANRMTSLMADTTTVSGDGRSGIEQLNTAITQIETMTSRDARLAEETASSVSGSEQHADDLHEVASLFYIEKTEVPAKSVFR